MARVEYPQILKKSDWDSHKGIIAQLHGETGLGAACETAERKYDLIDWRILEPAHPNADIKFVEGLTKVEFRRHILPASEYMLELKGKCEQVAAQFKRSSAIPASSRLHVERMSQTAAAFSKALRDTQEMNFGMVLSSPAWLQKFQAHCRSEFNDNELDFVLKCKNAQFYPEFPPTGKAVLPAHRVREIFDEFIAEGSPRWINLAGQVRNPLLDAGRDNSLAQADWQPAIRAMYWLLMSDTYPRFMAKQRQIDPTLRWS